MHILGDGIGDQEGTDLFPGPVLKLLLGGTRGLRGRLLLINVVASFISVVVGCTFPAGSVLGSLMGPMRGERKHEIKSGHHSSFSETASLFFYSLSMGKLRSCPPFLTSD